jgi:dolichol kinase
VNLLHGKMVDLYIGALVPLDVLLAGVTALIASLVLTLAYYMAARGMPKWKSRKLVHVSMGSVIAFTVFSYNNLSGPAFTAGLFLTILMYAWAHKSELVWELLSAGSREGESRLNTFASGFMGVASFALVFLVFFSRPEIFTAAILAVSWGDAAGEVFGRPFGGRIFKRRIRNKSVEGSIAVFAFTTISVIASLMGHTPDVLVMSAIPQIVLVGLFATLAEMASIGWTDNFLIPWVTSLSMWLLLFPGIPLFPL